MSNVCGICNEECFNICEDCNIGTCQAELKYKYIIAKCYNKCIFHNKCINEYYEKKHLYCPQCKELLLNAIDVCECCDCELFCYDNNIQSHQ